METTVNLLDATERRREVSAIDEALANIAADGARRAIEADHVAAKVSTDRRCAFLGERVAPLAPAEITQPGMIGGMQMLTSIFRVEHAKHLQADYLLAARRAQLKGNRAFAAVMLAKAKTFARDPRLVAARSAGVRSAA